MHRYNTLFDNLHNHSIKISVYLILPHCQFGNKTWRLHTQCERSRLKATHLLEQITMSMCTVLRIQQVMDHVKVRKIYTSIQPSNKNSDLPARSPVRVRPAYILLYKSYIGGLSNWKFAFLKLIVFIETVISIKFPKSSFCFVAKQLWDSHCRRIVNQGYF